MPHRNRQTLRFFTLILLAALLPGCANVGERGASGYRVFHHIEYRREVPGAFARDAQFSDLYYQQHRLASVRQYSISPSGRFALFEDDGKLMLFDRDALHKRNVTDGPFAIPSSFTWSESTGTVDVDYHANHPPSRIVLPR